MTNAKIEERDREAVVAALGMDRGLMATWIATGSDPGVNYDTEERLAQAIADARAEGERRGRLQRDVAIAGDLLKEVEKDFKDELREGAAYRRAWERAKQWALRRSRTANAAMNLFLGEELARKDLEEGLLQAIADAEAMAPKEGT